MKQPKVSNERKSDPSAAAVIDMAATQLLRQFKIVSYFSFFFVLLSLKIKIEVPLGLKW